MKNKLLKTIVAGIILASSPFALANDYYNNNDCCCSNWYIAGSGSVAWHNAIEFQDTVTAITSSLNYKTGWGAAASIGYIFDICNQWDLRLEGEFVYRRNRLKNNTLTTPGVAPVVQNFTGHNQDSALMANLLTDIPLFCDLSLYLGGGIGASFNRRVVNLTNNAISQIKTSSTLFAWQLLAGLSYSFCPNIALTAGYRLFATEKTKNARGTLKSKHIPMTHSVDIGLCFRI